MTFDCIKMIPVIYDDKDGVVIQFDLENGLAIGIKMTDEAAQEF